MVDFEGSEERSVTNGREAQQPEVIDVLKGSSSESNSYGPQVAHTHKVQIPVMVTYLSYHNLEPCYFLDIPSLANIYIYIPFQGAL